jgi:hypothetical protein
MATTDTHANMRALLSRGLGDQAGRFDPLLDLAKGELQRMPARGLAALEHLVKASVEGGKREQERLEKRHGKDEPRARARGHEASSMAVLAKLVGRLREAAQLSEEAQPMRIKGTLTAGDEKARAGATIEAVEDSEQAWVAARTLSDPNGSFELVLEAPAAAYAGAELPAYRLTAHDAAGKELARSEAFDFKAGETLTIDLVAGRSADDTSKPSTRAARTRRKDG